MKLVRVALWILLAFSVLAYGAVEQWAQAVLEVGLSILLVASVARLYMLKSEQISISPLLLPLLAFALVIAIQLLLRTTASPYHTRIQIQLLAAYLILVFLMPLALERSGHWRTTMWFLMALAFTVSIFGLLQFLTYNGKLYWVRAMRYGGAPFGPYVNRNHFGGFAELLIPVALVPLVLGRVRRERRLLVVLFAMVPIVALFLSASRGGIFSFVAELIALSLLLLLRRVRVKHILTAGIVLLVALSAVFWIGSQQILQRFSGSQSFDVAMGKRISMQRDTLTIFTTHPVLGTGLGTLQTVFPRYDSLYDGKVVNHSHNDYLEALAETGVLGALCCIWFIGVLLRESIQGVADAGNPFQATLNLSGIVGCCGILIHSLVDFNLHIPANALLFFVSAHMATAKVQPSRRTRASNPLPRLQDEEQTIARP